MGYALLPAGMYKKTQQRSKAEVLEAVCTKQVSFSRVSGMQQCYNTHHTRSTQRGARQGMMVNSTPCDALMTPGKSLSGWSLKSPLKFWNTAKMSTLVFVMHT